MKILTNAKTVVSTDGKSVTITAEIVDEPWNEMLVSRTTHGFLNPNHQGHPRHVQSSNAAIFCRHRGFTVALPNDVWVAIAAAIDPNTSFAPLFKPGTVPPNIETISESPVTFQWQVSENAFPQAEKQQTPPPPTVWSDIPGQTAASLDESTLKDGQWIRCVATNATGSTISKPAQYKK